MGIYPHRRTHDHKRSALGGEFWQETETEPGIIRRRSVQATPWVVERTDCYCCSCPEFGGADPACRNHGWAAARPCEVHQMSGSSWDDGTMPDSVQVVRARRLP